MMKPGEMEADVVEFCASVGREPRDLTRDADLLHQFGRWQEQKYPLGCPHCGKDYYEEAAKKSIAQARQLIADTPSANPIGWAVRVDAKTYAILRIAGIARIDRYNIVIDPLLDSGINLGDFNGHKEDHKEGHKETAD